jgi:hypothetical protein
MNQKRKSTSYSSITWNLVKNVFKPTDYEQRTLDIDNAEFEILFQYITRVMKCLKGFGNEAKRLHFIAPILVWMILKFVSKKI